MESLRRQPMPTSPVEFLNCDGAMSATTNRSKRNGDQLRRLGIAWHLSVASLMLGLLTLRTMPICATRARTGEYCDTEVFRAECGDGEVILMERATYGRMKLGRCVEMDLGYIGCFQQVLDIADRRCSAKRVCEIRIPDAEFEGTRPCLKELKTYLEASYRCVTVEQIPSDPCRINDEFSVTSSSGFIVSTMTSESTSCDGQLHPWVISVPRGQRVNLTLYDFVRPVRRNVTSAPELSGPSGSTTRDPGGRQCRGYGKIADSGRKEMVALCGSDRRISPGVYLSRGNFVRIWIFAVQGQGHPRNTTRFLVGYSPVGCPDVIDLNEFTWFRRTKDGQGIVGCHHSNVTWKLSCHDNAWTGGAYRACSGPITELTTSSTVAMTTISVTLETTTSLTLLPSQQNSKNTEDVESISSSIRNTNTTIMTSVIGLIVTSFIGVVVIVFIIIVIIRSRRNNLNRSCDGEDSGEAKLYMTNQNSFLSSVGGATTQTGEVGQQRHLVNVNGQQYEHVWPSAPPPLRQVAPPSELTRNDSGPQLKTFGAVKTRPVSIRANGRNGV